MITLSAGYEPIKYIMNKSSCSNMRMIDREKTCCRKVNQSEGRYVYNVKVCGKAAPIQITVLLL
jgi:hypothetical protein